MEVVTSTCSRNATSFAVPEQPVVLMAITVAVPYRIVSLRL